MKEAVAGNSKVQKKGNVPNKDAYKRTNFLYQAAATNLAIQPENIEVTQHYMKCLRQVKEKKVLRWSREMKQSICKGCNMLLVPGVTTKARFRANNRVVVTCLTCNAKKRVDTKKPVMSISKKKRNQRQRKNIKKKKEKKVNGDQEKDGKNS